MGLDENILRLNSIAKEGSPPQQDQALSALRMIRDYRHTHPRRVEGDLSNLASGLPARVWQGTGDMSEGVLLQKQA
jgi:hypothetical protein